MKPRPTAFVMLLGLGVGMGLSSVANAQQIVTNGLVQPVPAVPSTKVVTNGVDESPPLPPVVLPMATPAETAAATAVTQTALVQAAIAATPVTEPAYDRVIHSGVLRCGYYVFSPLTARDPKTGVLSGLSVEMTEALAAAAGLKVEWTEEVDFGSWMTGLQTGLYDALCTPSWPDAGLARAVSFTRPIFYSAINIYARAGDMRFDNNFASINNAGVTIAVIEGTPQVGLAQTNFPRAHLLLLPQNSPGGAQAVSVAARKADLLFWDENGVYEYLKANPGALHNVVPDHPVRVMPFELAVNQGEYKLRDLLDVGVQTLQDTGATDQLLTRWERVPNGFYRVAKPYVVPAKGMP